MMPTDTIVMIDSIPVMFVAGRKGAPIPDQAPEAFSRLEKRLPSLKGRKFYGVILGDEYRACVVVDIALGQYLPYPTWKIPGGRYVRRRILNWEENISLIGPAFDDLAGRPDVDLSRPLVEYYRSQRELLLMVPVK